MSGAATYYYICDECGSIADITEQPHPPEQRWACGDCIERAEEDDPFYDGPEPDEAGLSLTEYTDKDEALAAATRISNLRYAAQSARLDQMKAKADEMLGGKP
jgi:hypothetical protein